MNAHALAAAGGAAIALAAQHGAAVYADEPVHAGGKDFASLAEAMRHVAHLYRQGLEARATLVRRRLELGEFLVDLKGRFGQPRVSQALKSHDIHRATAWKAMRIAEAVRDGRLVRSDVEAGRVSLRSAESTAGVTRDRRPAWASPVCAPAGAPDLTGVLGVSADDVCRFINPTEPVQRAPAGAHTHGNQPTSPRVELPPVGAPAGAPTGPAPGPRIAGTGVVVLGVIGGGVPCATAPQAIGAARHGDVKGQLTLAAVFDEAERKSRALSELLARARSGETEAMSTLQRALEALRGVLV